MKVVLGGDPVFILTEEEEKGPGRGWWGPPKGTHGTTADFGTAARGGKIDSSSHLGGGIMDAELIAYEDDGKGVWKEMEGILHDGNSEVATYKLANLLGLDNVPETVYSKNRNGVEGTSQLFVEDAKTGDELWDKAREELPDESYAVVEQRMLAGIKKSERADVMALDLITKNIDRHSGNFLVSKGKLWAIDHGHATWGEMNETMMKELALNSWLWGSERVRIPQSRINQWRKITREEFNVAFSGVSTEKNVNIDNAWKNLRTILDLDGEIG